MMKVLLISANTETINMPVLPLGLACVDSALEHAGFETQSLNLMGTSDTRSLLENSIRDFDPDAIGISVRNIDDQTMTNTRFMLDPVKAMIDGCRKITEAPVILGGAGYSIFPEATLDYLGADMGIKGEGEIAFPELLRRMQRHAPMDDVPGLYFPNRHPVNECRRIRDLSNIPLPRPGVHLSVPDGFKRKEIWLPFQTRRGCPMNCSYCSTGSIEGRIIRKFPHDAVIGALSEYVSAGFTKFFFVDNTFNLPPSHAETLCDRMIAENFNIQWRCILYPAAIHPRLIEKFARAGCVEVSFGFESGSDQILHLMNKRYTPEDIRQASAVLSDHHIQQMGFLLLGGPGETPDTLLESLSFADSLQLDALKLTLGIRIYPDTPLARIAQQEGVILPDDNLLLPKFYLRKGIDAGWAKKTIALWMKDRSNWFMQ
jgi:radical SAM superfamily enzyme YgiQ (UPF0313 family)